MIERVLLVSLGSIGERHLRLLRARLPNAKICVLRSGNIKESQDTTTSLDVALNFSPQIAIVASPAPFHMKTTEALIKIGCSVLIEKPIAAYSDNVAAVLDDAQVRGVSLAVGYNMRFLETMQKFRNFVLEGCMGRILSIRAECGQFLPDWRPQKNWRETVSAKMELGGGVLRELSHEIDYLRWIFGEIDWTRAWLGKNGFGLDVEDTAFLTLGFQKHIGNIEGPPPVGILTLDFVRRDRVRSCTVIGETGTLIWDLVRGDIRLCDKDHEQVLTKSRDAVDPDATYKKQLDSFLEAVIDQKPLATTAYDGLAVLKVIEAAERSHLQGGTTQWIT